MIDWWKLGVSCPVCGSKRKITRLNKFKRKYVFRGRGWKIVEIQKMKCNVCGYEFWEEVR